MRETGGKRHSLASLGCDISQCCISLQQVQPDLDWAKSNRNARETIETKKQLRVGGGVSETRPGQKARRALIQAAPKGSGLVLYN